MPQAQTVDAPLRLPLLSLPENRDGSPLKDGRMVNCYGEKKGESEYTIYKRAGLSLPVSPPGVAAKGQGMTLYSTSPLSVFAEKLYTDTTLIGSLTGGTNKQYYFEEAFLADNTTKLLVLGNGGTTFYFYDVIHGLRAVTLPVWQALHTYAKGDTVLPTVSNGFVYRVTAITTGITAAGEPVWPLIVNNTVVDAGVTWTCLSAYGAPPASLAKGFAYLDSTLYIMDIYGNIYGSAINDPFVWDPLNKIVARTVPGTAIALARHLSYVVALKQYSTEFFWDAANSAGSPLGPVQGLLINYGCLSDTSVQNIDGKLLWICTTRGGCPQVGLLEKGDFKVISTNHIDKLLSAWEFSDIRSWFYKAEGHTFYVITSHLESMTLAYDLDQDLWSQWTDANGNYLDIAGACAVNAFGAITHYWQSGTNGNYYTATRSNVGDNGAIIPVDIYTPNYEGGVRRKKTLFKMEFEGDQQAGSTLRVRCSEDDYQTWSSFRDVDLGTKRPSLFNCGTFVRRSYNFHHESLTQFRLAAVHLQLDLGTL